MRRLRPLLLAAGFLAASAAAALALRGYANPALGLLLSSFPLCGG